MENKQTTFVERLELEASELLEKKLKLAGFLSTDNVKEKIGEFQHALLTVQIQAMSTYLTALEARLLDLRNKQQG